MNFASLGQSIGSACTSIGRGVRKHAPEICITLGIIAGIGTVVTAVTGTIKAKELVDQKKAELGVEKLPRKVLVQTIWKCYIPTALFGIGSAAGIISGTKINIDRGMMAGAMYNVVRDAYNDQKAATEEVVGEEKAKEIEKKVEEKSESQMPVYFAVSDEKIKFVESLTNAEFIDTKNGVIEKQNDYDERLNEGERLTLNDWLYYLKCRECGVGDNLYWDLGTTGLLKVRFDYGPDSEGKPAIIIKYMNPPVYDI